MTQDGLKHKDKDLAKMKKHILELLDQAWTKGYISGCNDGYATGRDAFKPKDGEWQQITAKDGDYYFYHKCTNCGQTIESGFDNPPLFNFCPNCGAKMGGEDE